MSEVLKEHKVAIIAGIVFLGIAVICVIAFTSPAISARWDFTGTGGIGDTIGGIATPIFTLLTAYLLYLSFYLQRKALSLNERDSKFKILMSVLEETDSFFKNLSLTKYYEADSKSYQGVSYIKTVLEDYRCVLLGELSEKEKHRFCGNVNEEIKNILYLQKQLLYIFDKTLNKNSGLDEIQQDYLIEKVKLIYDKHMAQWVIDFLHTDIDGSSQVHPLNTIKEMNDRIAKEIHRIM